MKKLFAVLFCTLVMSGAAFADEPSYEIDPIATAKAPWKVGEKIIKEGHYSDVDYYLKFLGVTQPGFALVQGFYLSEEKLTDPFLMTVTNAEKLTAALCPEYIEGRYIQWYKNGQKDMEFNFKNGKLDGIVVSWHKNGQKRGEGSYKNGKEVGIWKMWDEKGNLIEKNDYDELEGLAVFWYENGQKKVEINFKNGKQEGLITEWYENGKKREEGNLKNNEPVGIWQYWAEDGHLIEEKDYGTPQD